MSYTPTDLFVTTGPAFPGDNEPVTLNVDDGLIEANVPQTWILVYHTDQAPPEGATFSVELTSAAAVIAELEFPIGVPAAAQAPYPIRSDEFRLLPDYELTWEDPGFWHPEAGLICLEGEALAPAQINASEVGFALWLPDNEPTLRTRPEYSARFSNAGVWNETEGHNTLATGISVGVADTAACEECGSLPEATLASVSSITLSTRGLGKGRKAGVATVVVTDDLGDPVAGAVVSGNFFDDFAEAGVSVTDAAGVAVFETTQSRKGSVQFGFCVEDIAHPVLTYEPLANSATCESL